MRVLIDRTVRNAQAYYRTYLREPSPAQDITFGPTEIAVTDKMDLKTILTEMKSQ
jgi:hypothetical protein